MESEKMKEIKKALKYCSNPICKDKCPYRRIGCINELSKDSLTLINDLESQNKRLLERCKNCHYTKDLEIANGHVKELKDRIVELEEALLEMVVQFCQTDKEGYLNCTFMSAEENAFDVLGIDCGEKVDNVYKRFNKRWRK